MDTPTARRCGPSVVLTRRSSRDLCPLDCGRIAPKIPLPCKASAGTENHPVFPSGRGTGVESFSNSLGPWHAGRPMSLGKTRPCGAPPNEQAGDRLGVLGKRRSCVSGAYLPIESKGADFGVGEAAPRILNHSGDNCFIAEILCADVPKNSYSSDWQCDFLR